MAGKALADNDDQKPSYYDISLLKPPVWKWEIAGYFFLGGISAGSYLLARLAERCGKGRYGSLTRAGSLVALATILPCPPLLIMDLGDRKRFHHMLRVFKPQSPMSVGSWTLVLYSTLASVAAMRELIRDRPSSAPQPVEHISAFTTMADAVGMPSALLLASYTGVLLSGTANPLWGRNRWLGPLFCSGSISTGAAAVSLALEAAGAETPEALHQIETAARRTEAAALTGFVASAPARKTLTSGKMAPHFWAGAVGAGLLLPELLEWLPLRARARRTARIVGAILTLVGGLALRWSVVFAGHEAASDPDAAREGSAG